MFVIVICYDIIMLYIVHLTMCFGVFIDFIYETAEIEKLLV